MLVKRPPVPTSRPIIVADDDAGDRLLIQQALEDCGVDADVWFAADGKSLLDELQRRARTAAAPLLVLLDLNMPRMDGREALRVVKRDPVLMDIPIVVLTNSSNPLDVTGAYHDGANTYIQKPLDYEGLVSLIGTLTTYWLRLAKLPAP